jgi:hypothetical protein
VIAEDCNTDHDLERLARIACYWTTHKGVEYSAEDVIAMLAFVALETKNVNFFGYCFNRDDMCAFQQPFEPVS